MTIQTDNFATRDELIRYLLGIGAKHFAGDVYKLKNHNIIICQFGRDRLWTFGYI